MSCLLKIPWPKHLQFNKELFECFIVQSISFKRDFFFSSSYFWKGIKRPRVSCCKAIWTQRKGCPCVFRTCKRNLQDSETLKRVAWGLDVGTRVWPNQYKSEFALSLSLNSFIYYCFIFIFKLFYLNQYLRNSLLREFITWIES